MRRTIAAGPSTRRTSAAAVWPALAILVAIVCGQTAFAAGEFSGRPKVLDGDTLDFAGRVVRLAGIDAPELDQTCRAAGRAWACGREARWAALNRVSPHWVTCVAQGRDVAGTERAVCYLAGIGQEDLGAWLLRQGWALAEPGADPAYHAAQASAQSAGRGLWRGRFVAPWAWRLGQRLPDDRASEGCSACDAHHQRLKRKALGPD